VPVEYWVALAAAPRPSFVIRVPLRRERPVPRAKLVTRRMVVHGSPMAVLHGVVLGPGEIPLMGAVVEVPALSLSTRTGHDGRFAFAGVPSDPPVKLRVRAKGREMFVVPLQPRPAQEPLVIHFDRLEV
jgi:hypothetical protein